MLFLIDTADMLLPRLQQDLLAAMNGPSGAYVQQLLGKEGAGGVGGQHPTPRSSLDIMALGRSEYSTPRTSFEVPQVRRLRSTIFPLPSSVLLVHTLGHF